MSKSRCAYLALFACVLSCLLVLGWHGLQRNRILKQRTDYVRSLALAYLNAPTNVNTLDDLLGVLARSGVKLNNPIPKDASEPCYRLVHHRGETNSTILIEETNITGNLCIVRASNDGSVFVQRRKPD